jgi:prepilin-type N-terminal cleavage/methylation domain-containing protein
MRRRSSRGDERGISLIEVMVAISLFSVLLALVSGVVIESLKSSTDTRNRLANLDQVRGGMDSMTKSLRTAVRPSQLNGTCSAFCEDAFDVATDYEVTFLANLGDQLGGKATPSRITYKVAPDTTDPRGLTAIVTETRQQVKSTWVSGDYVFAGVAAPAAPCTVSAPVPGCVTRQITKGLRWPFPVGEGPAFVYYDAAHVKLPATSLTTSAQRTAISAVDITLPVGDASHPSPSVLSSVFLPNSILGR